MQGESNGCVLFADVSGSTKLYEMVGDKAAHAAIDLCVKLFSALTEQHGGRVIKTIGDEVMAIFPDAKQAARAFVEKITREKLFSKPIVTEIAPASEFHMAEDYHQEYFRRVGGGNPYCSFVIEPKVAKFRKHYMERLKR